MGSVSNTVVPFSLKDAPSLIEQVFPSMKISAEAQKERKSGSGQILTSLGSYWKGRKPLILVRACVLGILLPLTKRPEEDLAVFESLMSIDEEAFRLRAKRPSDVPELLGMDYERRVALALRPDEVQADLHDGAWERVNAHLGTHAASIPQLVEQLGIMRYGHRPRVADTFGGGGSIPFEAARAGCAVYASDLNPIACVLMWGAFNIVGATPAQHERILSQQAEVAAAVASEIEALGVERDRDGNRAKAYLYCLETICPATGWRVPMAPSWVVSNTRNVVAELVPNTATKTYDIVIKSGVDDDAKRKAQNGTVVDGRLVHPMNPDANGVSISQIRGDRKEDGRSKNNLRLWDRSDFEPRPDDIFQERLYCIQWIDSATLHKARPDSFFSEVTPDDLAGEETVASLVAKQFVQWRRDGIIPDMPIEAGDKTDEPIRTRGWSYWHQLFSPRQLLIAALIGKHVRARAAVVPMFFKALDYGSKLCRWDAGHPGSSPQVMATFTNQALNTLYNYGVKASSHALSYISSEIPHAIIEHREYELVSGSAIDTEVSNDIYITDPPYADAVNYHEITEFFIAWMRKNPPAEFAEWNWDSRRRLAIKGKGEDFRASMVKAYRAMADHMADNGVQIVMFTHQDGKVWSDMAQIFWGAGLQVMADWYIATETTSELKKGGYVQGTHIIVLRKRAGHESGYADEITQEVKEEVARQIEEMVGLNQSLKGHGRSENLFNDADLQMAGYAAALRVLTKYVKIDGKDMTIEALRPRAKLERTVIDDIIEYAVQIANEHLVPEGMTEETWRRLSGSERFYLKMMDIETTGAKKVDNYQNFAKAFRVADYGSLMASVKANDASLKSAKDFGKRQMGQDEFGSSLTRAVLFALFEMASGVDDDLVLAHLRDMATRYMEQRPDLVTIAIYMANKRKGVDPVDSRNATILAGLIKNQRLG